MENKTQNQPKDNGEEIKKEQFDVFISYRGLDTITDPNDSNKIYSIHSTSLARSIYQKFDMEGFNVFFDRQDIAGEIFDIIRENRSRYYIVLVTNYSIETIEKYHYNNVEETENRGKGNEEAKKGLGYNFAKELFLINNSIKNNEIDKKKVFLFRIDNCLDDENNVLSALSTCGYTSFVSKNIEVINFPTNQDFSIKKLIERDEEGKIKINKARRLSYKTRKRISNIALTLVGPIALALCFLGYNYYQYCALNKNFNDRLNEGITSRCGDLSDKLAKYENEFIVFAGGGTVQQYLQKPTNKNYNSINVNDYPFSKYVHMPSSIAWHLLFDDVNDGNHRYYCPIILSAGEIDTKEAHIEKFMEQDKKIAEYKLDSIPLKVQIYGKCDSFDNIIKNKDTITISSIREILKKAKEDYTKYAIWTTTEKSGTYFEYKKLLNDNGTPGINLDTILYQIVGKANPNYKAIPIDSGMYLQYKELFKTLPNDTLSFNLDDIVNKQPSDPVTKHSGGRIDFNLNSPFRNKNKTTIILANEHYKYKLPTEENPRELTLVSDNMEIMTVPLFVYTIAEKNPTTNGLRIIQEAAQFLDTIGCDTKEKEFITDKLKETWGHKKKQQ